MNRSAHLIGLPVCHKIIKTEAGKGFLMANNHGFENGWTKTIYGKVIRAEYQGTVIYQSTPLKQ